MPPHWYLRAVDWSLQIMVWTYLPTFTSALNMLRPWQNRRRGRAVCRNKSYRLMQKMKFPLLFLVAFILGTVYFLSFHVGFDARLIRRAATEIRGKEFVPINDWQGKSEKNIHDALFGYQACGASGENSLRLSAVRRVMNDELLFSKNSAQARSVRNC